LALALSLAFGLMSSPGRALAQLPQWAAAADTANVGAYDAGTPAVVLLDERSVAVDKSGRTTRTRAMPSESSPGMAMARPASRSSTCPAAAGSAISKRGM